MMKTVALAASVLLCVHAETLSQMMSVRWPAHSTRQRERSRVQWQAKQALRLQQRIVDPAGVLTPEQRIQLRRGIDVIERFYGTHVVVVVVRSMNGANIDQYLVKAMALHQPKNAHQIYGVLLFVATRDKIARVRATVALEEKFSREVRRSIEQQAITPPLSNGNVFKAVGSGLRAIAQTLGTKNRSEDAPNRTPPDSISLEPPNPESAPMRGVPVASAEENEDSTPPTVTILNPPLGRSASTTTTKKILTLRGVASDANGIFEVSVNGKEIGVSANGDFTADLKLGVGENAIRVRVSDTRDNVSENTFTVIRESSSADDTVSVGLPAEHEPRIGKYYGLIIGIDAYSGVWPPLSNAVHDARGVESELRNEYRVDSIITLYNQAATRVNVIRALEQLTRLVTPSDNVLIYFSGHGDFNRLLNRGAWVPVDAQTQSAADLVSNSDIQTFLNGIPSKHTLLIADACFSGDIFRGLIEKPEIDDTDRYYQEVSSRMSRQAMTSGGIEPVMDGGKEGHSVFTYYLLKSLRENTNKLFDAGQLYESLKVSVANNSEQTPVFQAVKNTGDEGGQFVFIRR